MYVKWPWYV
nr:Chain C, 9-mer peptide from the HCoV spike protein [Human coronavirus HKU1]